MLMASSNYSLLFFSSRSPSIPISSKFPILSSMIHSRRQHPVVLKEKSGVFLGSSGLMEKKGLGCSINLLQRNSWFGSIRRRCNKGWGSEGEGDFDLEAEISEFMDCSENPSKFPTKKDLINAGRGDLVEAIEKNRYWLSKGGWDLNSGVEEDDAGINGSREKETDIGDISCKNDWKLGSSMFSDSKPASTTSLKPSNDSYIVSEATDFGKGSISDFDDMGDSLNLAMTHNIVVQKEKIANETGEDKTKTESWWRSYVNANKKEYYANRKLINSDFQPPPLDEEGRYVVTEPFFYNEAERRYHYFVKALANTVKESLKQLMMVLMVVPLSFIILAFALKDKVDVVMKTVFHDDKVSSQEQEDSDEEYIPASDVKV